MMHPSVGLIDLEQLQRGDGECELSFLDELLEEHSDGVSDLSGEGQQVHERGSASLQLPCSAPAQLASAQLAPAQPDPPSQLAAHQMDRPRPGQFLFGTPRLPCHAEPYDRDYELGLVISVSGSGGNLDVEVASLWLMRDTDERILQGQAFSRVEPWPRSAIFRRVECVGSVCLEQVLIHEWHQERIREDDLDLPMFTEEDAFNLLQQACAALETTTTRRVRKPPQLLAEMQPPQLLACQRSKVKVERRPKQQPDKRKAKRPRFAEEGNEEESVEERGMERGEEERSEAERIYVDMRPQNSPVAANTWMGTELQAGQNVEAVIEQDELGKCWASARVIKVQRSGAEARIEYTDAEPPKSGRVVRASPSSTKDGRRVNDTPAKVAERYGVPEEAVLEFNEQLFKGAELEKGTQVALPQICLTEDDDTLGQLARKFGCSAEELLSLNSTRHGDLLTLTSKFHPNALIVLPKMGVTTAKGSYFASPTPAGAQVCYPPQPQEVIEVCDRACHERQWRPAVVLELKQRSIVVCETGKLAQVRHR